ncbi:WG repeat-containing protein [Paenibacillus glycanilyticus]|uniref:WG repeat-containing protein n=1 Tax=Paenibacillus glycanilyticus TaxID=126569 RepID=A0ABQ6G3X9_9BACL|nr:WG repeat-containing protein [Paenibacillus glycanilyticus]GLX65668.1 hypothetical protein MU1_00120 [Paenibacillus glycanilyticus]
MNQDGKKLPVIVDSIYPYGDAYTLIPFKKGGGWGFIDTEGDLKIKPVFDEVEYFSNSLSAVMVSGKWGYIGTDGDMKIAPKYLFAGPFYDDEAIVATSNNSYELIDINGAVQKRITAKYEIDEPIRNGISRIRVVENGRTGYINLKGDVVIECNFLESGPFVNGLAWVRDEDNKYYYINTDGQKVVSIPDGYIPGTFSEGMASLLNSYTLKSSYINTNGQVVINEKFSNPDFFSEGLALVMLEEDKYCYITTSGELAFSDYFDEALPFINGGALVSNNGVWGLIDKQGKYIFTNKHYDYIDTQSYLMNSSVFLVQIAGKSYSITRNTGDAIEL